MVARAQCANPWIPCPSVEPWGELLVGAAIAAFGVLILAIRPHGKKAAVVVALAFAASGCGAHSPFILTTTTDTITLADNTFEPHQRSVFVTEETLPGTIEYAVIAQIDVGRVWYGAEKSIYGAPAERARQLGADAVIQVDTWLQPSGWAWAVPHGRGKAVKILTGDAKKELSGLKGRWE